MRAVLLTIFVACGAKAEVILDRSDRDPQPTFQVKGGRDAVASNLTFLASPLGQPAIQLNQPILLTINPMPKARSVLKGPLQARFFRLDGNDARPRHWGRAKPNASARASGAVDCLIFLSTVLAVHPQFGAYKDQFALTELDGRGWLTADVAKDRFLPARYLVVFETENDDNGIFRVEEEPAVEQYFSQGSVITVSVDSNPVRPGEVADVAKKLQESTKAAVALASKTGADVECKTAGVHEVSSDGTEAVALSSCGSAEGATVEMLVPG